MIDRDIVLDLLAECGFDGRANHKGEMPLQFCPFHEHNFNSPSLQINVDKIVFYCYSCHTSGNIRRIFYHFGIGDEYLGGGISTDEDFEKRLQQALNNFEMPTEEQNVSDQSELQSYRFIHPYLLKRGYTKELIVRNRIGFDKGSTRITVPVFSNGHYYGCIKRTVLDIHPRYVYPANFQKSALLYSPHPIEIIHNEVELWCEGSLDALKAAQHGYIAKAILGCSISKVQIQYLEESPREIVLALDNDEPGQRGISELLRLTNRFDISILQYPEGTKDVGEMTKEQLDWAVTNRKNRLIHLDKELSF